MSTISNLTTTDYQYKSPFTKLDKDGNGKLTESEFTAGKPKEVSDSDASAKYKKIAGTSTDGITEDQLKESMKDEGDAGMSKLVSDVVSVMMAMQQAGGPGAGGPPSGPPPSDEDVASSMDADSSGAITKDEFVSSRPDGVSEEDATKLFSSFDTENTGSVDTKTMAAALKSQREEQQAMMGPPPGASSSSDTDSTSSSTSTDDDMLSQILAAIQSYKENGTSSSFDTTEALLG